MRGRALVGGWVEFAYLLAEVDRVLGRDGGGAGQIPWSGPAEVYELDGLSIGSIGDSRNGFAFAIEAYLELLPA